uniref:Nebulin isoform X2 n=1 Tax=Petromyzon marinus TaxID=7757 RepID=A0AAJ7T833_PETMA|nr:nebulin isoform X2 [Petromyzon marinus]
MTSTTVVYEEVVEYEEYEEEVEEEEEEEGEEEEEEEVVEEVVEEVIVEDPVTHQVRKVSVPQLHPSGLVHRKVKKKRKVDTSKFMTPYLAHSKKMMDLFSEVKYKEALKNHQPKGFTTLSETPRQKICKHAQDILSEVKYRDAGRKTISNCHVDEKAWDIAHSKKISAMVSKILYKKSWEDVKDRYLLPSDCPEMVQALKNASNISQKVYHAEYELDRGCCIPYFDSPELRRVAKAQKTLSDVVYKMGHEEHLLHYTQVVDAPDMVQAKKTGEQLSDMNYHDEYVKSVKGKWSQAPCYDVAVAKMNSDNISINKYKKAFNESKDKLFVDSTDTPEYQMVKKAGVNASQVKYRAAYEKTKDMSGYNTLPATENPAMKQARHVSKNLSDHEYKKAYHTNRGHSINICDTPQFKSDTVLKKFTSNVLYKEAYERNRGHYIGSPDDPHMANSRRVADIQNAKLYKADYEADKTMCYFPMTITAEYEAMKKVAQFKDLVYKKHPDTVPFTQSMDSPVMLQAKVNARQLSDVNYKQAYEKDKFRCNLPADYPPLLQARANAYNLSENAYKMNWDETKDKKFEIKLDSIPIVAAKKHSNDASEVKYKKAYEKNRGKMIGALSIEDDPKLRHSIHVAKIQSEREYKKDYEKAKTKYHSPLDMMNVTLAKKSQAIASNYSYKQPIHSYFMPPDAVSVVLAKQGNQLYSNNDYRADYNNWFKGIGWQPFESVEQVSAKKASAILSEKKYRQHPDTIPFTQVTDSPVQQMAKVSQDQQSNWKYKAASEDVLHKYTLPHDAPEFLQSRANAYNISKNSYKAGWNELISKGYDLKLDAIPIIAAKKARKDASDVHYKLAYEKARGHMVGCRNLQDDPKLVHSMHVAKMQSNREYKKDFEKSKTKYHTPVDMVSVISAKKSQAIASNYDYVKRHHRYSMMPDSVLLELAKKANEIQSDNLYRSDFVNIIQGCGWIPIGSLEQDKVKKAGQILSEAKYRQHPDTIKFTSVTDDPVMVQSQINAKQLSDNLYKSAGKKSQKQFSIPHDIPQFLQSKINSVNFSENSYKHAWVEDKNKGYDSRADAIPIKAARASRDIASDYKYKQAYEKARGHMVGCRNLQDDPKLVHSMHVAKMQSEREYKKDFEKSKTKYHTPVDMVSVATAKKSQAIARNYDYKQLIHNTNVMPDAMSVQLAKHMNQLQSDNLYKADLDWIRGTGWIPIGSLEQDKVKKAGQILSEAKYRQHPDTIKFTSITDDPVMVQSQINAKQLSDMNYKASGEAAKHKYTLPMDLPQFLQAKANAINISESKYKKGWEETISKGYDSRLDAIPIKAAKASRDIASDFKYKQAYEKARGHMVGCRNLQDDPKLVHSMHVAKMQSEREYKKGFEKSKTKFHSPVDMVSVVAAKQAQAIARNYDYKQLIHNTNVMPDAMSVQLAKHMNQLQSDNLYKADLDWIRGTGWIPIGSLEQDKVKKAGQILSEAKYRQHPDTIKFTSITDDPVMVQSQINAKQNSEKLYKAGGEESKHKYTMNVDDPMLVLAKANAVNMSKKLYRQGWEETISKGYDSKLDAIPIKAAKASRDIVSDYKYKQAYEKARGHMVGCRNLQDDPKLVHSMNVAKMQSEREYKKGFEKSKTKFHSPVDMVSVVAAKQAQAIARNYDYKQLIHNTNVMPDAMSVQLAKHMNQLQSDNLYKADMDWIRGMGWVPIGSLEQEKVKKAGQILSEAKYRQHPDTIKFTSITDDPVMVQAQINAKQNSEKLYRAGAAKTLQKYSIPADSPGFLQARLNAYNFSVNAYKSAWGETIRKGYDSRADAIPIKAARASRDIASDYKYKQAYEKSRGHMVGCRDIQDDPKLVHSMNVAKMQSEREYKKGFEKSKTKFHSPVDMVSVVAAKQAQAIARNYDYKQLIHNTNVMPDAMSVQLAKHMNQLQSDNLYKADLDWIRGTGWIPIGSLEQDKVKKAGQILSEAKYRQHPDTIKFTSITDDPVMVQAQINAKQLSEKLYKEAWENDKTKIHVTPDAPEFLLAKANSANASEKLYKLGWKEYLNKGYDSRADAIAIKAAKASRDIASDYKYKLAYEKGRGHMVGCRNLQDDPKLVHCMNVAKMQSEREYKKGFEKTKTKYHSPVDMISVVAAKHCQKQVNDFNYRTYLHQWTCMPDQNDVIQARKAYELQSDNLYKGDLSWLRGIGWVPIGSLESEKVKKAGQILSEAKYRQHPDTIKFTSITDDPLMVQAQINAKQMDTKRYKEAWEKAKTSIHIMPDTPEFLLAKLNKVNVSEKHYKQGWLDTIKKGYDLRLDAISIKAAKASRDIASDYKYKLAYEKGRGHMVGCRNLQDDPKLVHCMNVAKIQSEREYKKGFEKTKTKYHSPVDMISVVAAKHCQKQVNDVNYRTYLHQWTCMPDQNDVIQAKKAYELQSDYLYKGDLSWLRGIGWVPVGSLESEKVKKAGEILSEAKYRQRPDTFKFTSITDDPVMVQAQINAKQNSNKLYKDAWENAKTKIHIMPDAPEFLLSKTNSANVSQKLYRQGWEETIRKGYDSRADAIPIRAAKASRDIASDYKYKLAYEKGRGHMVGCRNLQDDPKLVHCMNVAKMQSEREYKKGFEKTKTKYHSPVDMISVVAAKHCQKQVNDVNYRTYLHQWTCMPDQNDVIQARKAYDLQSDYLYKGDLSWLRGIGWVPVGSLESEKVKKAGEILSEAKYRQRPDTFKFTSITDDPVMVQAQINAKQINDKLYRAAWEGCKTNIHIMPDTPQIVLSKLNTANMSQKLYRQGWEETISKGYDSRADSIAIKAAKASRDIASDYKYKLAYEKGKGHMVGCRNLQDDPKLVWFMHVAKMQSEREYKKGFEKTKTKYHSPVDMISVVAAKHCQKQVNDVNYRTYLHQWTCMPDQNDVIQAKKAYELQSDNIYKEDLNWLRGTGWVPMGSLEHEKVKNAGKILSERRYRQSPDTFKFTSIVDDPVMVLAQANAKQNSKWLYRDAWDKDKSSIHVMPDTPEITLAKLNSANISQKLYRQGWEETISKGYDSRADSIAIKAAKASRDIASDYKYKLAYEKGRGHMVGCRNIQDDPKLVWSMHVAKIQSEREYKKGFEKTKTKYHSPVDMISVVAAKHCQKQVNDVNYRTYLHQWTCMPDQNDVIQARKAYELQSDNIYKEDLNWLRGTGWVPMGSLEHEKVKNAGKILSERRYRQSPDTFKFTSIVDDPVMVLAQANAKQNSKWLYRDAWDKDKLNIHVMPDTPEFNLAKQNAVQMSNKLYRQGWEDTIQKGYASRSDAIAIKAAKASRDIASDYKYKLAYEKGRGHMVGCRNIQDDPKLVWFMQVAKMQSDREYKKGFEKTKTKYHSPVDMISVVAAKHCQKQVNDVNYRTYLHQWTCMPDQNDVIQARKAYELQSDNIYKDDLNWLRGIGWSPDGSLEHMKVKHAGKILSNKFYRQNPDSIKFTSIVDDPVMVQAQINAKLLSNKLYKEAWENAKTSIHVMPDTPEIMLSKLNSVNVSGKLYRQGWEDTIQKGYASRSDAIAIKAAKASRDIASDYKYKLAYEKGRGHMVGCRNLQDDPKLVHCMNVAKMQSDREYKKGFEKSKTKFHSPVDMISVVAAKHCQKQVNDFNYRTYLHQWTCMPDQNDVIQAKKAYELQSDWLYKSDLEWLRGCGWQPDGSVDVEKVKKAQEIINERKYRQPISDQKFTSITDLPIFLLAKTNSALISDKVYKEAWQTQKTLCHIPPDTPLYELSKVNSINISDKLYRKSWDEAKVKGYHVDKDAISVLAARKARDIASDIKYKMAYEKGKGHHVGCRNIQDDPKLVWSMHVAKMQSEREYKKGFEKSKTKYHSPVDMISVVAAKHCQKQVNDVNYRTYLHQWTCMPDQNDVIQAKKAYDLQSNWVYKADLEWLRGCGWLPEGSLDVLKVKKAQEILNDRIYRQPASSLKFTSVIDSPEYLLAKTNADQISGWKYKKDWELNKTSIHIMPDTPEINLSRANAVNVSRKQYRKGWEDALQNGYHLKTDAIAIKAAKASREIISDYKYKHAYELGKGHLIGCHSVHEDPMLEHCAKVGKMQSDLEYKKDFHKTKTKCHLPHDMLNVVAAKKYQEMISDIPYRTYLHQWTCMPDQNDVIQARKAYDLQSDIIYKADLEWIRGCGWLPTGSLDVEHSKKAQNILSNNKYKAEAYQGMKNFSVVTDTPTYINAVLSAHQLCDYKYKEAWNRDKSNVTVSECPLYDVARDAARNLSSKIYKEGWENMKATGYKIPADSLDLQQAKLLKEITSEIKYKHAHIKDRGHLIGCHSVHEDPMLEHCAKVGKMQSDLEYKKDFHKTKTKCHLPHDMLNVVAAKKYQEMISDIPYRTYLHQWTCMPDQNDVIQARKAYDLQSDFVYKADLEWLRGCGWLPSGSVDVEKVKRAQNILNDNKYKSAALQGTRKYIVVTDTPAYLTALQSGIQLSDVKYKEAFNLEKGNSHMSPDAPQFNLSREASKLCSEKLYKESWDNVKSTGYILPVDYLPLVNAKNIRNNSLLKYKEEYEQTKAHIQGMKSMKEFPSVALLLNLAKNRSQLEYTKGYEKSKSKVHIPADMLSNLQAKKCQQILSELEYRRHLHQWTCHPEQNEVLQARKAYDMQSDILYKDDLTWLKGIGCNVYETPDIMRAKNACDLISPNKYKAAAIEATKQYSVVTDTPAYITALRCGHQQSDNKYKQAFIRERGKCVIPSDSLANVHSSDVQKLFSNNLYKEAWDQVKASSYSIPSDSWAFVSAKDQKEHSDRKYREEYERMKARYCLPRSLQEDPKAMQALKAYQIRSNILYRDTYEKNKARVHIAPDMFEMVGAKATQRMVSGMDYRTYLHHWVCKPDLAVFSHARKVNEQLSDVYYKDDLSWIRGVGVALWDTPEIKLAKEAYNNRSDNQYKAKAWETMYNYTQVDDAPEIKQAIINAKQLSDLNYRHSYVNHIRGHVTSIKNTVELDRARNAALIQSEFLYRNASRKALPSGYTIPVDMPLYVQAKKAGNILSDLKYKETYENNKAKMYHLIPDAWFFRSVQKAENVQNERLYREIYHKNKDKIHPSAITPELRQVKITQHAISNLAYKADYERLKGHYITLPYSPELLHHRHVGNITSDIQYKEDMQWLKGLSCLLHDTPNMRHAKKIIADNSNYGLEAKKAQEKYCVVLDTPGYVRIVELKDHLSEVAYRAIGNEVKTKFTPVVDTPAHMLAKNSQEMQSQYLYKETAHRELPHIHSVVDTPLLKHAKSVKHLNSDIVYQHEYNQNKAKYTLIPDSPFNKISKKAYENASDLRYKEAYQHLRGKYHTVKDARDIVHHRKVTDKISDVKYKQKYMNQLGIWHAIPDHPDYFHHRLVTELVSDVKYKEDLTWLKGIGSYAYDTPDLTHAKQNRVLYSHVKYTKPFEAMRDKFTYSSNSPAFRLAKHAGDLINMKAYHATYEKEKSKYHTVLEEPRHLLNKDMKEQYSQWVYKHQYEQHKDKYTTVLETPYNLQALKMKKLISENVYKAQYNKNKAHWFTPVHDATFQMHLGKIKDRMSIMKYKEDYEKKKAHINIPEDYRDILAAKKAYKAISNLEYKTQYEKTKAKWGWIADRPDVIHAVKTTLQQSDVEYKYDREMLKGCKLSVVDDRNVAHALHGNELASEVKYRRKYEQVTKGTCIQVAETPLMNLMKRVTDMVSQNKYKASSAKILPKASFTHMPETRETVHIKEVSKMQSHNTYKEKFEKEKGKSNYAMMVAPPDVAHAVDVAKKQSNLSYKKDAKSKLPYTSVADRPDILKAKQAAKLISDIEYRAKAKEEKAHPSAMVGRPDIELAKEVSKLTSQVEYTKQKLRGHGAASYDTPMMRHLKKMVTLSSDLKYKEKFDKEVKGQKPTGDLKEMPAYKTAKDATSLASEVKYKQDLKKMHNPACADSLLNQHVTGTSKLASEYCYKKVYEDNKGHYILVADSPEQIHLKEASDLQSQYKYKEEYEKNKGKGMLDFETPTYVTNKETQQMQSEKEYKRGYEEGMKGRNLSELEFTPAYLHAKYASGLVNEKEYKRDLEEGTKGKGLTGLEVTPDLIRARSATHILSEREYKKDMEAEIRGRGMTTTGLDTPDFHRVKNATDILSQAKYNQTGDGSYTTVVDTPDILHAQQVKTITSQKQYKEHAQRAMSNYQTVMETPELHRVRENQKHFSSLQYKADADNLKGKVTTVSNTPEIQRVKENQKNFSSVLYKEGIKAGTSVNATPELRRVKENTKNISSVLYKEGIKSGTAVNDTPELQRVRATQKNISSVLYKDQIKAGTSLKDTPEIRRVKQTQDHISSIKYKEQIGTATVVADSPEYQRARENQKLISMVKYKEQLAKMTPINATMDTERVKRAQGNVSAVLYADHSRREMQGRASCLLDTPEMRRVRENQRNFSLVKYHEDFERIKAKGFTAVVDDPITERVKRNTRDVSDISYRGIQRRTVEIEQRRLEAEQETTADLRVWRTNPGSIFDYDPAEDNIQSKSLYLMNVQAQRRSREHSRSASALSISTGDERSEGSELERNYSYYSNNAFYASASASACYQQVKTVVIPQQRSSSVVTQQTTVSSIPSHPSTTGRSYRALYDYTGADDDEVTFKDGDVIINVQPIDEGWMYGTVQRSGKTGMLPANYVEAI